MLISGKISEMKSTPPKLLEKRIRQARVAAGRTQQEVVEALGDEGVSLTKAGLSKYERGGSTPPAKVVRALARVLDVDSSFFFEEPSYSLRWLAFRKDTKMGKRRQERVKAQAEAQLRFMMRLRRALEPGESPVAMPLPGVVENFQQAEQAAVSLREAWGLGEQPIESVTRVVEDAGGLVIESGSHDDLFDGLAGWIDDTVPVIAVSPAVSEDRRRFSIAHELGHLFMRVEDADEETEEKLAHRFAAAFLVPPRIARRELGEQRRHLSFRELALLKEKHGLSMQAWILRAEDVGIIDAAHRRTLFAELGSRGWRKQEPVELECDERPTKLAQWTARALAEGLLSRREAERVCPGVSRDLTVESAEGPLDPRILLELDAEERGRLLEQAAEQISDHYGDGGALANLGETSEEDFLEPADVL